ncbi:MAG: NhaP-type Na+/H+ or K+/H+ antiporter [Cryomorphaceae bacterium]|jgi:NhaP-type Na+/H+ or K+/H+ antiporter
MQVAILVVMLCVVFYAFFAKRLASTIVTAPIIFLGLGYAMSLSGFMATESSEELLHLVAETALIILLFADASQTDFAALKKRYLWPKRMLLIGLPLAIVLGTGVASLLFPSWSLFAVALVASILAPTDAALGQAVVSNKDVPIQERRTLVVESGLNDGLALPIILFFACTLATMEGEHQGNFLIFTSQQLILGPSIGALIGWLGGRALLWAEARKFSESEYEGIAAIAVAITAYVAASMVDGNGFIAAFCAGLAFGNTVKERVKHVAEFVESEGQILVWASFLLMGIVLLPEALHHLNLPILALIGLSLFVIRPLAIWISLIGTDARPITRMFFGWFGPRGLATALFALLIVGDINHAYAEPVLVIAINAVWISALLHGISAAPGAAWYARRAKSSDAETLNTEKS